ncbi:hypothetical protein F4561_002013 [Lipingzhangella halophila]|uniref:Uncharacterized protein n=1 Tax=Lipingzhangella halophila TaxID=1783352 RepID=A0A7W7RGG1_9ACTN|nr:hypothetical protein [Lipingzhangella halophila]MBB4931193.1 hypothetical protein [Lipingzhangella halophila]
MRYLTPSFAIGALHRGQEIEQFLGGFDRGEQHIIRWAALGRGKDRITLYLSEAVDAGTDSFLDVSEFPPLDPDDESWGKVIGTAASPGEALALAEHHLGASRDRWVNQGVICSEYKDYRAARSTNEPLM